MFRPISILSSVFRSSKSHFLPQQAAYKWRDSEVFCAEREAPGKGGQLPKETSSFITFVLGGPGSGKGTQCLKIADVFGFTHISAGDLLRKEITENSEKGRTILETIREGKIVPSELTVKLIQTAIRSSDNNKFLIDGFPRTEENRKTYEKLIGTSPNIVLFFDLPEEEMIRRVLSRNEGRVDDNEDTIKMRLRIFHEWSLPVINYYSKRGLLHRKVGVLHSLSSATTSLSLGTGISAMGSEEEIFERVRPIFEEYEPMFQ